MYFLVGASVRALAQTVSRSGHTCRAADLFADFDTAAACEKADRMSNLREADRFAVGSGSQGCVIAGGMENHCQTLRALSRIMPIIGSPVDSIARVRDPLAVAHVLASSGLPALEVRTTCPNHAAGWMVKPVNSVGGHQIRQLTQIDASAVQSLSSAGPWYFQRYVQGTPMGAAFVGYPGGCLLIGASHQIQMATANSEVNYVGSIGPLSLSFVDQQQLQLIGTTVAAAFGLIGWFGIDIVANDSGFWTVEVNPRYTASMELYEWAWNQRLFDYHLEACRGETAGRSGPLASAVQVASLGGEMIGKKFVFNRSGSAVWIGESEAQYLNGVIRSSPQSPSLTDIPQPHQTIEKNHPICTVWARGDSIENIRHKLELAERRVEQALLARRRPHRH